MSKPGYTGTTLPDETAELIDKIDQERAEENKTKPQGRPETIKFLAEFYQEHKDGSL